MHIIMKSSSYRYYINLLWDDAGLGHFLNTVFTFFLSTKPASLLNLFFK